MRESERDFPRFHTQDREDALAAAANRPVAHASHTPALVAPTFGEARPAAHGAQNLSMICVTATAAEPLPAGRIYRPVGHALQPVRPRYSVYLPAGQLKHIWCQRVPLCPWYLPCGHQWHANTKTLVCTSCVVMNLPLGQCFEERLSTADPGARCALAPWRPNMRISASGSHICD